MNGTLDNLTTHPTPQRRAADRMLLSGVWSLPADTTTPIHDRRLLVVLELINENIRRQLMIRELATIVNLSPGRLAHLFKSEVGVSPQRYVNKLRLEKAKELLASGMLSVKEIAAEIGFPNVSTFCRSFRACYATTPREYRNIHLRMDLSIAPSTAYPQMRR
ncbi:MAG: AraC family transcriptional regulator [Blastocatellia bacterium]|jgi:transcriptional regulator GlxA family with amidase domain|nr:AraC family transcriptional regulator [Blastocatellia bacterium]